MAIDPDILEESLDMLFNREPEFTHNFYTTLFERHPEAAELFAHVDMDTQETKLSESLVLLVQRLEDAQWLETTLFGLGASHEDAGVDPEMYPWVASSLLDTARSCMHEEWTPAIDAAWTEALQSIAEMMLVGHRARRAERAA
ncbi:MAG: globin domain-containing protein [Myxococcota bacterium]